MNITLRVNGIEHHLEVDTRVRRFGSNGGASRKTSRQVGPFTAADVHFKRLHEHADLNARLRANAQPFLR
jgi:hypothetical protein